MDTLAYYRHIAPLERKDIYLLHGREQRSLFPTTPIPTTSNLHYYSPNRDSEIAPTACAEAWFINQQLALLYHSAGAMTVSPRSTISMVAGV